MKQLQKKLFFMKTFQKHLSEIRQGGISVLLRKAIFFYSPIIPLLITSPIAIPVVVLVRLIRPWIHFRFGHFSSDRIGEISAVAGRALSEYEIENNNSYSDWYTTPKKSSNQQWTKMVKRNFRVRWWIYFIREWNTLIPGGTAHVKVLALAVQDGRDRQGWLSKTSKRMAFLPVEENAAKSWLRKQGWTDGELFVCLLVRDSAYLAQDSLHRWTEEKSYYHNYRDSDISTYVQAMEYLAEQGIWVLRMGKKMKKPIPSQHRRFIDYSFHPEKSDLLDVWLFANCYFCMSTASGPDNISDVYQRPLLFLNASPLSGIYSWSDTVCVPKHLVWRNTGKHLNLREYLESSYDRTQDYEKAGIEIIDLSQEEIVEAAKERVMRIRGTWVEQKEDIDLQNRFWKQLKGWSKFSRFHGWIHPRARVGAHYLRSIGSEFYE
jgi:putative glycosyltransferase (TIGR04372 family)